MAGASVETTLELWASSLREVKGRIRPLFDQHNHRSGTPDGGLATRRAADKRPHTWGQAEGGKASPADVVGYMRRAAAMRRPRRDPID